MQERHADPIDEATALAATLTEGAIAAARRASAPESHPDFDGENCLECGDEIPKDRLALGKIRCVKCQTDLEHRRKQQANFGWGAGQPVWSEQD
ncbi:paraquat-inducible protein A [Novimethylophilus kurashikiensis]|uniref:Paraquat-inducible protein A n=1 Tax=Novimethylophilus kurashikiensis TaxID=1825523 RepID=A0A2R5FBS3_9PROT|nr:TraR/DksA C4-type zinc finger protein [Novimethylophilus kurashikiensis]GBG14353.1 paraquat-inducible protein A [Novimethylophilus kurashikiensis]